MGLVLRVTLSPGVSPMDRGYLEDLLCSTICEEVGGDAESIGGGSLMGQGTIAESDFDLECTTDDAVAVVAVARLVLTQVPFTMRTRLTIQVDEGEEFAFEAGGEGVDVDADEV